MSRHCKIKEAQNYELNDEMRTLFIARGLNTNDQFIVNMMMRGEEGYQKLITSKIFAEWCEKLKKKK